MTQGTARKATVKVMKLNSVAEQEVNYDNVILDLEAEMILQATVLEEKIELRKELEAKKLAAMEAKRDALLQEKKDLLAKATGLESKAAIYKMREDIDEVMEEREVCLARVAAIDAELGTVAEVEVPQPNEVNEVQEEKETFWEKALSSTGTLVFAVVLFGFLSWFSYGRVEAIGEDINVVNKLAQDSGDISQMLPPSISKMSFQKAWFSWLTIFSSLLGAIVIMAVIAPAQLIFILPFTKTPVKKWKHFFEQEEHQKQWQSGFYVAVILFFLALCHVAVS